jgi:RNA-directed DNA polymerase
MAHADHDRGVLPERPPHLLFAAGQQARDDDADDRADDSEIPKPHGDGVRTLGVPKIADRVAQTVVAMYLEPLVEPRFHPDSYGYRPDKSAHEALAACRQRCWECDWVIDLDVQEFFDTIPWDLMIRAVEAVTDCRWVLLYVKRWLQAPLQLPDGSLV